MTTLTRAKKMTRIGAIGVGIALALVILVRSLLGLVFWINESRQQQQQQAQNALPNVSYGQINAPQLQPANVSTASSNVQLDLVDGTFPQSSASAKVYKVATPSLSLSAQDRARARGTSLGFSGTPSQPDSSTFQWSDAWRQLTINLTGQTFTLESDLSKVSLANRSTFTQFTSLGTPATNFARTLFGYDDMQFTNPIIRYVNPVDTDKVLPQPSTAARPTNFAQISFIRQSLDGKSIYSASGKTGPISMIIIPPTVSTSNSSSTTTTPIKLDQVVRLVSQYFPINRSASATYPIIDAQAAFDKLKASFAQYLVSVEPTGTVLPTTLRDARVLFASLVYLEPDSRNTQYIQPVWMFEGRGSTNVNDANWVAYVPAIDQNQTKEILNSKK